LIDHVGGFCAWSALTDARRCVNTIDLRVDYLAPAPCEDLIFEASVVDLRQRLIRSDVTCYNKDRSKKIAIGRVLFNVYETEVDIPTQLAAHLKK